MWPKSSGNLSEIIIISGKNPLAPRSGYASYSYNLAKILSTLGYQVKIFCFGPESKILQNKIGTVHIIGSYIFSILKGKEMAGLAILSPKLAISIFRAIHGTSPVIIWGIGPWGLSGAFLKLLFPKKFILLSDYFTSIKHEFSGSLAGITIADHGFWNKFKILLAYGTIIQLYTLLEYFLLKVSDRVITHYQSTEHILTSQFSILNRKYVRLPYHIELRNTSPSNKITIPYTLKPKPLILTICRHDGRKGINFLLHAFFLLNSKGLKYKAFIIGEGRLRNKHIELARKLRLSNVYQPGSVISIKPYINRSNLFVLPSLEEGSSSLAILEAMKAGLPTVATNIDGIPEDLEDGISALLVPARKPEALADAMQKLLENPKLAKKLGKAAEKIFQKKHNLIAVKKQLNLFISEVYKLRL